MDRCALFVDAGYVLADGAMAVHGTRRRESVSWDYPGLLQLFGSLAMERSRLPLLRCYWYEATVEGRRSTDHDALADLPGVKLRLAKMRPGRREGVESEIHRDLTTLARNKAVSDAMVVSAEEDLAQVISDVQDMGMRVTLLNISVDGEWTISRTLRQECDDIVEISSAHLRPYVELISGAEPPRGDERDGMLVALRPNGNGQPAGRSTGYPQPGYQAPAPQAPSLPNDPVRSGSGAMAAEAPSRQEPAARQDQPLAARASGPGPRESGPQEILDTARESALAQEYPAAPEYGMAAEYGASGEYGVSAEYGAAGEYGAGADYGTVPDFTPTAYDSGAAPAEQAPARPEPQGGPRLNLPPAASDRTFGHDQQQARQDYGARPGGARPEFTAQPELPPRPEFAPREDLYAAPAAITGPAEDLPAERPPGRALPGGNLPGYSPGGVREQFQPDAIGREPAGSDLERYQPVPVAVPAGSAQIRRLPARGGQPGPGAGQLPPGLPAPAQQPGPGPVLGSPLPGQPAPELDWPPQGGTSMTPVLPPDPNGTGYASGRTGSYAGPPLPGAGAPGLAAMDGPMTLAQPGPPGLPGAMNPLGAQPASGPMGQAGMLGQADGGAGQPVRQASGAQPALSPVPPPGLAAQQNALVPAGPLGPAGPMAYSGGQGAVSLADAVQSAHEEGQEFGDSVARDAPALWLEAVLARKPRMPSDLEARLLQGSALPIDFLLHDEVRHALRRGFWDALERARR